MTERDNVTYIQTVPAADGTATVVVGITRGDDIRQHIVRRLTPAALAALEHDVDTSLDRGEDPELTIAAWAAVQGE